MKYKLVLADFDNTLGVGQGIVEQSTVETIKEYQKRGGIFVICTGRMYDSIIDICKENGFTGDLISYQGAIISNIESEEVYLSGGLSVDDQIEIVNSLLEEDGSILIDIDKKLYFNKFDKYSYWHCYGSRVFGEYEPDLISLIKEKNGTAQKVIFKEEKEKMIAVMEKLKKQFKDKYEVNMSTGEHGFLMEVINPVYSKGNAVKFLAKKYNIPMSEVMTIGDSLNDISFITCGAYGVCVGDGFEELKKVANEVTVPFKEKPVEYLLKKYCL